jgi:O-antigen ligase
MMSHDRGDSRKFRAAYYLSPALAGPRPVAALTSTPVEATSTWLVGYVGANVALSFLAQRFVVVSTVWALATLLVGLVVLSRPQASERMVIVASYIVGAELIWRGTHARVFWEYGKYALILVLGLAFLKAGRQRVEWRAIVFIACMVPSLTVLPYFDRQDVAFNISGPVSLGVAVLFFSNLVIDRRLLVRLCVIALGPIVGLAALSSIGTVLADPDRFIIGGKTTTAGIGPNQVSSVFAVGMLLVVVLLLVGPRRRFFRIGLTGLGLWLTAQTLLSFSRGGLWTAAGSIVVASYFVLQDRRSRRFLVSAAGVVFLILRFAVFPATDRYTGGMVSQRFTSVNLTGRDKIMKADWIVFRENPLLGVGPGQSYGAHAITFRASEAHTEYTRLLAEHGSLGVVAILMLASMTWSRLRQRQSADSKGLSLAFTAWALLYMGHSAMRLAAPAFMFGLGGATLVLGTIQLPSWVRNLRRVSQGPSVPEP